MKASAAKPRAPPKKTNYANAYKVAFEADFPWVGISSRSQSELCLALYISGMVFLFYLSVLPYLTVLFCNLYFIKCLFINMMFHIDLCFFYIAACLVCL